MKFSTQLSVLALALGVTADQAPTMIYRSNKPSLVERDLATVTNVISSINDKLKALDTAVTGFSGDAGALTSAATDLSNTIKTGTTTISGSTPLELNDALALQSFVQGLQGDGNKLVSDLAAKKSNFEKASLCNVVLQQANDLSTNSKALIDAVVSKVPTAAQTIAAQLASGFTTTLAQSQATFAQGNCTNADGTSSGSLSSSSGKSGSNATTTTSGGTTPATSTPATFTGAAAAVAAPIGGLAVAVAMLLL